jgi:predicted transcriptional regulator
MKRIFGSFKLTTGKALGPLEQRLLQELWSRRSATVRELVDDGNHKLAYTTVMTTLDRLFKKRVLNRVAEGKAFRYSPRLTLEEFQRAAAGEAILQLFDSGAASSLPLSYLVEILTERDTQLLDDLQQLVEEKRRELRNRDAKGFEPKRKERS